MYSLRKFPQGNVKHSIKAFFLLVFSCNNTLKYTILFSQAKFLQAKSFYSHESFGLAAEQFEMAVDEYFPADNECRALCEGAYNYDGYNYMEYSADLFQSMTGRYFCAKCH